MGFSYEFVPAPPTTPETPPADIIPSSAWLNAHDGGRLIGVCVAFLVLTTIFVALRFWARRVQRGTVGIDDYVIYPALFSCWITQITCIVIVPYGGVGTHAAYWEISGQPFVLVQWIKYIYAVEMCALLAMCWTKLAILSIYTRILRDSVSLRVAYACIGITLAAWVGNWVACSLQCIPFEYQWDKTIPGGHCFNQLAFYQYLSIPNILTDLVLLVLPFPTIVKLHTSCVQKVQLAAAFLTGSFGIVSSILRLSNFFMTNALADPTYNSIILLTWTVIEPSMYLISACLPVLRPLLDRLLQKLNIGTWSIAGSKFSGHGYKRSGYGFKKSGHNTQQGIATIPPHKRGFELSGAGTHRDSFDAKEEDEVALAETYRTAHGPSPDPVNPYKTPPNGRIMQTNNITVSHSAAPRR